jgi:hypothetical protein
MHFFSCATVRYPELANTAIKNHGSVTAMALYWGQDIKGKANQARAQQVRYFKQVWLANGSPHAIVSNVLTKDLDVKEAPMIVQPAFVESGVKNCC